jgi:hypothetical protein
MRPFGREWRATCKWFFGAVVRVPHAACPRQFVRRYSVSYERGRRSFAFCGGAGRLLPAACELRAEGVDIGIISRQLGHKSTATTADCWTLELIARTVAVNQKSWQKALSESLGPRRPKSLRNPGADCRPNALFCSQDSLNTRKNGAFSATHEGGRLLGRLVRGSGFLWPVLRAVSSPRGCHSTAGRLRVWAIQSGQSGSSMRSKNAREYWCTSDMKLLASTAI